MSEADYDDALLPFLFLCYGNVERWWGLKKADSEKIFL